MLKKIKENEFNEKLKEDNLPIIVLFKSEWCHYCKKMFPIVEEIAEEYKDKADVFFVDVSEEQKFASEHDILSIPVTILFKQGKEAERIVGFVSKDEMRDKVEKLLK
jgi:thioredoxin 1